VLPAFDPEVARELALPLTTESRDLVLVRGDRELPDFRAEFPSGLPSTPTFAGTQIQVSNAARPYASAVESILTIALSNGRIMVRRRSSG
jgi:hypothetical protein